MKGSEKQVKWAEDIKAQAINNCKAIIEHNNEIGMFADENELYEIMIEAIEGIFAKADDAATIINKRSLFFADTINANVQRAKTLIKRGNLTVEQFAKANGVIR